MLEVTKKGEVSRELYACVMLESIKMDLVSESDDITPVYYIDGKVEGEEVKNWT